MRFKNIIKLDYKNKEHINAVAKLHAELLPESVISQLGKLFLKKFYYTRLTKDGLINCDLYKLNNQYIAFIVCTKYPFSFMKKGKHKNFLFLIFILFLSLICNPARIKIILKMLRSNNEDYIRCFLGERNVGQFLSFGVLKEHRHVVDYPSGLRISRLMMERVFNYFKNRDFNKFFLLVLKSNHSAITLYKRYGGEIYENQDDKYGYIVAFNLCKTISNVQKK